MHRDTHVPRVGSTGNRDVDPRATLTAQPPERARAFVTQDGLLATSEHRGHPLAQTRQVPPADGVDATIDAVQTALGNAVPNCPDRVAESDELEEGDHAVLVSGQRPDSGGAL